MTSSNLIWAELDSTFDLWLEYGLSEWRLCALQLVIDDESAVRPNIEVVITHTDATNLALKIGDMSHINRILTQCLEPARKIDTILIPRIGML